MNSDKAWLLYGLIICTYFIHKAAYPFLYHQTTINNAKMVNYWRIWIQDTCLIIVCVLSSSHYSGLSFQDYTRMMISKHSLNLYSHTHPERHCNLVCHFAMQGYHFIDNHYLENFHNPNCQKSHKISQRLSSKHPACGVAQSP